MENMVMVKSASNYTLVINVPELSLHRVFRKKGAQFPIDRKILMQAYYDPAVEGLFKEGLLVVNDINFLKEVGLVEEEEKPTKVELTDAYLNRLIKVMPIAEVRIELGKLTHAQLEELADYAIEHYTDLSLDRADLFSKASGRNIMKGIEHYRSGLEG